MRLVTANIQIQLFKLDEGRSALMLSACKA
jgi:hypothetical protein